MKKFLTLAMSLLLILGLSACGETQTDDNTQTGLTPYEVVEQANAKLEAADGVAYKLNMDMKMTDGDDNTNNITMTMNGDIKMEKLAENNYNLAYHITSDMSSVDPSLDSVSMDMYYTDGYMYYDMMGIQYKVAMDITKAMETINSTSFSEIEQDMVKEQSQTSDGAGQVVNLLLDGSKMTDMVKSMSEEFAAVDAASAMTIGDIPYTVYLDGEGNITNIEMSMALNMAIGDMAMTLSMDTDLSVEQVGDVTVDLPDNLADYEELSLDTEDLEDMAA